MILRSFDIGLYVAFVTVVVSTLYVTRSIFERVKKQRQNQLAPIPTISGSIRRHSQQSRQAPQIQLNNNQFNPEILNSRFLYIFVVFLIVGFFCLVIIPIIHDHYHFTDDTVIQVIKRLSTLGFFLAILMTVVCSYPYVTNEHLRRFIADEFFN